MLFRHWKVFGWQDDVVGVDYTNKSAFNWIFVIRLPDFISKADFNWAVETATKKRRNSIVRQQSILRLMKDYVFKLCI